MTASIRAPVITVSTLNTERHVPHESTHPPKSGASTGANPLIIIMMPMSLAVASPFVVSATMERASTAPTEPLKPIRKRAAMNTSMVGEKAHSAVAAKHTAEPISSGVRRPVLSESGPIISCPSAMPIMKALRVMEAAASVVCSSSAMVGSEAIYMSMPSGAMAVSAARVTIVAGESPNEGFAWLGC